MIKDLPWENSKLGILQEECKEEILKLSKNEKTFYEFPPEGEYTEFDIKKMEYLAPKLCEIDKNLSQMTLKLIRRTKLSENDFWRNYFYHINLIQKNYLDKAQRWLDNPNKVLPSIFLIIIKNRFK